MYNKSERKLITVGKVGKSMFKRILTFCLVLILWCFAITAQAADRWKWYESSSWYSRYYDTQTVEPNARLHCARVWTKIVKDDGTLIRQELRFLVYDIKGVAILESVEYWDGSPHRRQNSPPIAYTVLPDSGDENLARLVAEQVGFQPMYPGGPDRWKWIHATDRYGLYVARDTLYYFGKNFAYSLWTKRVYTDGSTSYFHYFYDPDTNLIRTETSNWNSPIPDSDEEAVLHTAKALYQESLDRKKYKIFSP